MRSRTTPLLLVVAAVFASLTAGTAEAQCNTTASHKTIGTPGPGLGVSFRNWFSVSQPKLGVTVPIWAAYSSGTKTQLPYVLIVGTKPADIPFLGHRLYVNPSTLLITVTGFASVSGGGGPFNSHDVRLPVKIPSNPNLCGRQVVIQIGLFDRIASGGVAFSAGEQWTLGK